MGDVRDIVRDKYGEIAKNKSTCRGLAVSCCGAGNQAENIGMGIRMILFCYDVSRLKATA